LGSEGGSVRFGLEFEEEEEEEEKKDNKHLALA